MTRSHLLYLNDITESIEKIQGSLPELLGAIRKVISEEAKKD
jgi:hypothetical protein